MAQPKLDASKLGNNPTVMEQFGNWTQDLDNLQKQFLSAQPFPHVLIENFFKPEVAEKLVDDFPNGNDPNWHRYFNPIEIKNAMDKLPLMPQSCADALISLNEPQFVDVMSKISDISNLEYDPFLNGAGLHLYPRGGTLKMHLDYSIHPITKKERRLNLLVYLNKEWDTKEWDGLLELWSADEKGDMKECVRSIAPNFNTAILFQTSHYSWHGIPNFIRCPENVGRKSIAVYYVSEQRPNLKSERYKAHFALRPTDNQDDRIKQLIDIRDTRLITNQDLKNIFPNWKEENQL